MSLTPLPIDPYRGEIAKTISRSPVTIITAETGAGKSTRVPLWLWSQGLRVHVTQPRRIAARALSNYLALQTGKVWGEEIGYQTGFESRKGAKTSLLYLTDGVKMLQETMGHRSYDTLILDEVHEWNLNQEILIGLVKKGLQEGRFGATRQRVVIMSATLDAGPLSRFLDDAPVISVPGRAFPVEKIHDAPYGLLPQAVGLVEEGRNILVFQPGKREIADFTEELKEQLHRSGLKAVILPLHAEQSLPEQNKVFRTYPHPKVVIATDIAQTSLTIEDIDAVVDRGLKKEIRTVHGIEGLYTVEISRAEALQRAGRAGRVKEGTYVLCSEIPLESRTPFPEPEIRRLNLDSALLRLLHWKINPLEMPFFHSPTRSLLVKSLESLKVFGALDRSGRVTKDGEKMVRYPLSVRSSRLLLEASSGGRRVMESALGLIAVLETRGIVNQTYLGESFLPQGTYRSDPLNQLIFLKDRRSYKKLINFKKAETAGEIVRELRERLKDSHLWPEEEKSPPNPERERKLLYRALISSLCDGLFLRGEGEYYLRGTEERRLERTSLLRENPPEMAIGIPFDLSGPWENPRTGEREETTLRLLTFASELSLPILDELKPFSYLREVGPERQGKRWLLTERVSFGGRVVLRKEKSPEEMGPEERSRLARELCPELLALPKGQWLWAEGVETLRNLYGEAASRLTPPPPPFEDSFLRLLEGIFRKSLSTPDLELFFRLQPPPKNLRGLLTRSRLKELQRLRWPSHASLPIGPRKILYKQGRPFLELLPDEMVPLKERDLELPTGERMGIFLNRQRFTRWKEAAAYANALLREGLFQEKWKQAREELEELPPDDLFPRTVSAGKGVDGEEILFYQAPVEEKGELRVRTFLTEEEAMEAFLETEERWQAHRRKRKGEELKVAFRRKGWKVKS